MSGELESYLRGLDLNTPNAQELINWSCKLTLCPRERDGGGGQPPVKSEVRAQSSKVGRLWFFGGRCSRISRGTPEARSRLCVCRASFLMTFVMSGVPLASSQHRQAVFHGVRTILPSPQQCTRVPISSPRGRCLSFSIKFFFSYTHTIGDEVVSCDFDLHVPND